MLLSSRSAGLSDSRCDVQRKAKGEINAKFEGFFLEERKKLVGEKKIFLKENF